MKSKYFYKAAALTLSAVMTAGTGLTVSARDCFDFGEIDNYVNNHTFGIVGTMTGWADDIPMYNDNDDGVYTGICENLEPGHYEFKVRADGKWDDSWGTYEEDNDRIMNSQINCTVDIETVSDLVVTLDTNGEDEVLWPISYAVVTEDTDEYEWVYLGVPVYRQEYFNSNGQKVFMEEIKRNVFAGKSDIMARGSKFFTVSQDAFLRKCYNIPSDGEYAFSVDMPERAFLYVKLDMSGCKTPLSYAVVGITENEEDWEDEEYFEEEEYAKGAAPSPIYQEENYDDIEWTAITKNDIVPVVEEGFFKYALKNDGTAVLVEYTQDLEISSNQKPKEMDVVIPDEIKGHKVTEIGYEAFSADMNPDNFDYINVILPDSMTLIGEKAFYNLCALKSIVMSDSVTDISEYAFGFCSDLKSVVMSKNIKKMDDNVFGCCTHLENIDLPNGITSIGSYAFSHCYALKSIAFPESLTEMGELVLYECSGMTDLKVNCPCLNNGEIRFSCPSNVVALTFGTGNAKVSIDMGSFFIGNKIKTVSLGKNAEIYSSDNGMGMFAGCADLEKFVVSKYNPYYTAEDGILYDKNKTTLIRYPSAKQGDFTIPATVKTVSLDAFSNCKYLTGITIHENIFDLNDTLNSNYQIYYNPVFYNCISLGNISVSENNPKYSSKDGILFNKDKTSLLRFPTTVQGSYTVPRSVKYLAYGSFNKTKLSDITIYGDTQIYSRYYGENLYYDNVFSGNSGLTIITEENSPAHVYAKQRKMPFKLLLTNLSEISAERIVLGQTVTVKVKANDVDKNCTYAVYYKQKSQSKWTVKQDFSKNDTVTIKPAAAKDYDICVKIKDSKGKIVKQYFYVKVLEKLENISSFSANSIPKGYSLIVRPRANGGFCESDLKKVYQYAVYYKKTSAQKWTVHNQYKPLYYEYDKIYDQVECITFNNAGDYEICVKIKDEAGNIAKKYFALYVRDDYPLRNESAISSSNIKKGESVVVKCSAGDGEGEYRYAVFYRKTSDSNWTVKQNFDTNDEVTIKPAKDTDYEICVKVKDKSNTVVKKYFTVTVTQ